MMKLLSILCALFSLPVFADTIEHYMNIADNIPKMEMKADEQAQAWAHSARNVLIITCESIAETMTTMNQIANSQSIPLYCLEPNKTLNATELQLIIQNTAKELALTRPDYQTLSISEVAWLGVKKAYPCPAKAAG